ncbi:AraC family transcriptional regulator [Sphingobacterium wenxiniae]|uniref:AraC-type DNA-binding protein n=1 Tax=Sphingobacterium wenxiniae TaxID=683125 RepID=A0A1I6V4Q4_9SPHI|nr:AraC family transcriptional regulator [Sphingobacterium wenxiniae]SFT08587.1 AraC-type DNA-binding protein [Sphingobacterium wenxiniae]
MKAKFHKVPKTSEHTFKIRHDILPHFGTTWHYHPEIELHYLIKGEGIRFIGENIANFQQDELILLGSNIPHTWKCNRLANHDYYVEALVLHFHPEAFGHNFLNLPETKKIPKLLDLARQGLIIKGESKKKIIKLMHRMKESIGITKIVYLLRIFDLLSYNIDFEIISANYASAGSNTWDEDRLNKVFNYTFNNFEKNINLEQIAELSNLSVTSFCRFFKNMTQKSYYDFLTEIRINHACRLLINTNMKVDAIAEESGFENTSNFYRHFKRLKNSTPSSYKKDYIDMN